MFKSHLKKRRIRSRSIQHVFLLSLILVSFPARTVLADDSTSSSGIGSGKKADLLKQPSEPPTRKEEISKGDKRLKWHREWRRVGVEETIIISNAMVILLMDQMVATENETKWEGPSLFDNPVRDALVAAKKSTRSDLATVSDILQAESYIHALLVDSLLIPWIGDDNFDTSWQLTIINIQVHAVGQAITGLTKRFTARERPFGQACDSDPDYSDQCEGTGRYRSFFSGHASSTAINAGLLCAHHINLSIYGNGYADGAACAAGIGVSLATSVLRIAADKHWASDVIVGFTVGFGLGYLIPELFYYRDKPDANSASIDSGGLVVLPIINTTNIEIRALKWF